MNKENLDTILNGMLDSATAKASDLVFVVGKPPQIEQDGQLQGLEMDGPDPLLKSSHITQIAEVLMRHDDRLGME